LLTSDPRVVLVDVREPVEWDINHIDGAVLIPRSSIDSGDGLARLPADRIPVLYCKTGVRSAEILPVGAAGRLSASRHLRGGISAWAEAFAPDMVMY
jgi:adenylyltransferase/sulfurtransferase